MSKEAGKFILEEKLKKRLTEHKSFKLYQFYHLKFDIMEQRSQNSEN